MENFIPPKKTFGTIEVTSKDITKKYYIGEAKFAIEKIGDERMVNIWANSYHYELHEGKKVLIGDVGVEIMQTIESNPNLNEFVKINFPVEIDEVESKWEELYFGHFSQFEHLKITNWEISFMRISDEKSYQIMLKGFITDDVQKILINHFVECQFTAKLETKINSRYNWNYSLDNPNAKQNV